MKSNSAPIIEIRNLDLVSMGRDAQDESNRLIIARGDAVAITAEAPADARRLLRVLATLERPDGIDYRFQGLPVELKNYRQCLPVKRQIGYVAADAAMISNRTLRENLLLTRFYYENDLTIDIDETVSRLLADARLIDKLDRRPSALSGGELLKAVAIREMAKAPVVMLVERPEPFMPMMPDNGIFQHLAGMVRSGTALVFYSRDGQMNGLANRRLVLAGNTMRTITV